VRELIEKEMKSQILVAPEPDMLGALGAALYASQLKREDG
jgi:activator of 2-hydroxyglutaryl-CoA dehydratase